jgi:hypothetical protein
LRELQERLGLPLAAVATSPYTEVIDKELWTLGQGLLPENSQSAPTVDAILRVGFTLIMVLSENYSQAIWSSLL